MNTKKYVIDLPPEERQQLHSLLRKGRHAARTLTRARVLLLADAGRPEKEIATQLGIDFTTVYRIEEHYVTHGLAFALSERPRSGAPPKTDASDEAIITAIACTAPPGGYDHWTLQLLGAEVKKRHREIKRMTLWRVLLKHDLQPWREKNVGDPGTHRSVRSAHAGRAGGVRASL